MVESAVTDIVCPAVAAEYPDGLLGKAVFVGKNLFNERVGLATAVLATFKVFYKLFGSLLGRFSVFECGKVSFASGFAFAVPKAGKLFNFALYGIAPCRICEVHAVAELCVVFEQGVSPCGTVTLFVGRVGARRRGTAVNGGAARRVGDNHVFAEELGYNFNVRSFAAACACAGELEEGCAELAALNGLFLELGGINRGKVNRILPVLVLALFKRLCKRYHLYGAAVLYGANGCAHAASHAVEGRYLHLVAVAGDADCRFGGKRFGLVGRVVSNECGTKASVRAYERAGAALYALVLNYLGNGNGNAALFKLGRAGGNVAVCVELRGL